VRSTTHDEGPTLAEGGRARFFTTARLGEKRSLTPEGFLLCEEVPIARTGEMQYAPGEVPVPPGADGIIRVVRDEEEVFRPEFILSFAGKPVVNDHPPEEVNPMNWRTYANGVTLNPRRGTGEFNQFLVADLLIQDQYAIRDVMDGKREVSCGYDADYEVLGVGLGRQKNMIGNHVALVDSGRCGPRCAIGDQRHPTGDCAMAKDKKSTLDSIVEKIRNAFKTKDDAALTAALEDLPAAVPTADAGEALHLHLGGGERDTRQYDELSSRVGNLEGGMKGIADALEEIKNGLKSGGPAGAEVNDEETKKDLEEEAPPGTTKDAAAKATDSALLSDSFQETLSLAEILVPGIQVPTYDRAAKPKVTIDAMCALRKKALEVTYATADGRAMVDSVLGGAAPLNLATMSCRDQRALFRAVGGLRKTLNSKDAHRPNVTDLRPNSQDIKGPIKSIADLNEFNRKRYPAQPRIAS